MAKPKEFKKPILLLAYWYRKEGDTDACIFIGDEEGDYEKQFLKYAKSQDWDIDAEDVNGVYPCTAEDDAYGRNYKIIVKKN